MMPRRTCHELGVCQARPGCTCCAPAAARVDTAALPMGDFYFAPGAIECAARRARRIGPLGRLALQCVAALAAAGLLGFAAGWLL